MGKFYSKKCVKIAIIKLFYIFLKEKIVRKKNEGSKKKHYYKKYTSLFFDKNVFNKEIKV